MALGVGAIHPAVDGQRLIGIVGSIKVSKQRKRISYYEPLGFFL